MHLQTQLRFTVLVVQKKPLYKVHTYAADMSTVYRAPYMLAAVYGALHNCPPRNTGGGRGGGVPKAGGWGGGGGEGRGAGKQQLGELQQQQSTPAGWQL